MHTFFTMEGGDSEFANFTLPTLKAFLKARSQSVSGNKQELVARAIGCPKPHFVPQALVIFWSAAKRRKHTVFILRHLSPERNSSSICT